MTVPVTKEHENAYPGEYKEIEYLGVHFQVKAASKPILLKKAPLPLHRQYSCVFLGRQTGLQTPQPVQQCLSYVVVE